VTERMQDSAIVLAHKLNWPISYAHTHILRANPESQSSFQALDEASRMRINNAYPHDFHIHRVANLALDRELQALGMDKVEAARRHLSGDETQLWLDYQWTAAFWAGEFPLAVGVCDIRHCSYTPTAHFLASLLISCR